MLKFSIIIPTYNDSERLPRAIKSVINQTVLNWELIVVDDGSKDDTESVIQEFFEDQRIQYIKKENAGVAAARNTGFKNSRGEYIVFLDSDDEIKSENLNDYNKKIESEKNIGIVSCGLVMGKIEKLPSYQNGISNNKFSVIPGSFCIKRKVFEDCGLYDKNLKQSENWEMLSRALDYCKRNNYRIESFDTCNLIYHHHKTPEQTKKRDLYRAEASLYLAKKYSSEGVLHFKKDDFLISAAVNYTRAGKNERAGRIFLEILRDKPNISNLLRLLIFKVPYLRRMKWMRVNLDYK